MFQTEVVEKIITNVLLSNFFFKNLGIYEILWKNIAVPERPHMTVRRMLIACWIPKATNTLRIFIAFPQQQWLHEHVSLLRCTYIACFDLEPNVKVFCGIAFLGNRLGIFL
jgi:hypothetical protein